MPILYKLIQAVLMVKQLILAHKEQSAEAHPSEKVYKKAKAILKNIFDHNDKIFELITGYFDRNKNKLGIDY